MFRPWRLSYFTLRNVDTKPNTLSLLTTFPRAVSRYMGAAMFCLGWMSSAMLYWVVSCFLARLFQSKYHPYNRKALPYHCSRPLVIQGHGLGNMSIGRWKKPRGFATRIEVWSSILLTHCLKKKTPPQKKKKREKGGWVSGWVDSGTWE